MKYKISVNRAIQILLFFLFVLNLSDGLFTPLFAVYVTDFIINASLSTVGFAIAVFAVTKSIIQVPLARRLDRIKGELDDFSAMLIGSIIGVVYPLFLIIINQTWQLYAVEFFAGAGTGCLMAAYYSVFSRHVDREQQGFEWSLFSVGGITLSVAIGGAIGGVLADVFGFRVLFLISSFLNFIGAVLLVWLYPYMKGIRSKARSAHLYNFSRKHNPKQRHL
ncbi:MFS transporter [Patescibacteria group bacterium]